MSTQHTTTDPSTGVAAATLFATEVAAAVADRAFDRLGAHLTDDVRLRALLPGGPLEETGRKDVMARFGEWFDDWDAVVVAEASGGLAGDRVLVHYTLVVDPDGLRHAVSQSLVCTLREGSVGRVDLVCSGFRRF